MLLTAGSFLLMAGKELVAFNDEITVQAFEPFHSAVRTSEQMASVLDPRCCRTF